MVPLPNNQRFETTEVAIDLCQLLLFSSWFGMIENFLLPPQVEAGQHMIYLHLFNFHCPVSALQTLISTQAAMFEFLRNGFTPNLQVSQQHIKWTEIVCLLPTLHLRLF